MKKIQKFLKLLSILTVVGLTILPANFAFATSAGGKELTDREKAAFIVRDEWTTWVNAFTASLSELDKNATSRIYDNMDFYDMQYRFTEKYKKVPEYLDEDGKPTQKLKDLIKKKRKEINGAKEIDYLCFTSKENGSKVGYTLYGSLSLSNIGISYDGVSFTPWDGTEKVINSGESVWVWNKDSTLSTSNSNYFSFKLTGNIEASGNVDSMINFSSVTNSCYYCLFNGQTALKTAPEVPSTTVGSGSYSQMFYGCTGMTTAPSVLPAENVPFQGYYNMFNGCSSLTSAPQVFAKSVGVSAMQGMFADCSKLVTAPELNVSTVSGQNAFSTMFKGCSELINPPSVLPAKSVPYWSYSSMFEGCTKLERSPHIKATNMQDNAMNKMFYGCSSLNEITIDYTGTIDSTYFSDWVYGVSNVGVIHYDGTYTDSDFGSSKLPKDASNHWLVLKAGQNFLTFTSEQDGSSVGWAVDVMGTVDTSNLYYSKNGASWTHWASGDPGITLNKGEYLKVWNKQNTLSSHPSTMEWNYFRFNIPNTGRVAASGNVEAMLNFSSSIQEEYALYELFKNCSGLTKAPKLGFTTLNGRCYYGMFQNCVNLKEAPELPATSAPYACYAYMFSGCTGLTTAPHLPATTIEDYCYYEMFSGCSNINKISLAYTGPFRNPPTPLDAFTNWVYGVANKGIIIYGGTDRSVGNSAIPSGDWTVQSP